MRRVAKDIEKSDTLSIADENVKCCISAESGSTVFWKGKQSCPMMGTSLPGHKPKGTKDTCSHKHLHMNIDSSITYNHPKQKQLKSPSTDQ